MPVTVDDYRAKRAISAMVRELGSTQAVMSLIGANMLEYVKDTIRRGGRKRPYAPLSEWTKRRTGRSKPLITLVPFFHVRATKFSATVHFEPPAGKDFDIDKHHRGWTTPARVGRPTMVVPIAGGAPIFFQKARASKIPAREIWPTQAEAAKEVNAFAQRWVREATRRAWQ